MKQQKERRQPIRKGWNPKDKEFLMNNFGTMPISILSRNLNRQESTIRSAAHRWGLKKESSWTKADEDFLIVHWTTLTSQEIGEHLTRTADAVNSKYQELKRKKTGKLVNMDEGG